MKGKNMQDLFSGNLEKSAPLADRMRPRTLDEFLGQEHIVGKTRCCAARSRRISSARVFSGARPAAAKARWRLSSPGRRAAIFIN